MKPPVVTPRYPDVDITPGGGWITGENIHVDDGKKKFLIPKGTSINFASLPAPARILWRTWGKHSVPDIVHDALYGTRQYSKAYVDKLYLRMMKDYGVNPIRRRIFYAGVRMNLIAALRW